MKFALIFIMAALFCGCTDDQEAIKAMSDMGFTAISIENRGFATTSWVGCSESDGAWYSATASNPAGKRVSMLVCCGGSMRFKGCSVRSK